MRAAWAAGQRDFGENKVQEALQKIDETADMQIRWHLIGHLQSNKAKKAAASVSLHPLGRLRRICCRKLDAAAAEAGAAPDLLVQVDLAGEATKFGAAADEARRIRGRRARRARSARMAGLMLIPPWNEDQEQTRPWFVRLRELRDAMAGRRRAGGALRQLSMGMSHDFEAAIEEGATLVRVGTAIFGKRTCPTTG